MRLKELRKERRLKQIEIAELINTTQQHYSKIELDKTDIPSKKLVILAKFYNVSTDYILGLSDDPRPLN